MNAAVDIAVSTIMRVMPENVTALWPQVTPLLAPELAMTRTHTIEDVWRTIMSGAAHLWIQYSDHVEASIVTEFVNYPLGLSLRVWLAGASSETKLRRRAFREVVEQFAKLNKCEWLEACGRHGWLRVFPESEYVGMLMRIKVTS